MVKLRDARYCNLKLILVFLVIYGHWIEPKIYSSDWLLQQYKFIYMFHMPLFAFLSGVFLKTEKDCLRQIKKTIPLYLIFQLFAALLNATDLFIPWWILWYLLSYCLWAGLGFLWFRYGKENSKFLFLVISIVLGILVGCIPWIDRTFSASRTFVFFPYFFIGLICKQETQWEKYRGCGLLTLMLASVIILLFGSSISVTFLYQATPFTSIPIGIKLRLICYLLGGFLGFSVLVFTPMKRFYFTKAGADTLPMYLIHAPIVAYLRTIETASVMYVILSILMLYAIYKLSQWFNNLYGIVPSERRDRDVGVSRYIHQIQ